MATTVAPSGMALAAGVDVAGLKPGLGDPVHESQAVFRDLLSAMARPGRPVSLGIEVDAPSPLDPATAAVTLTMVDNDTPLWIDWIADTPALRAYLKFHCACPLAEDIQSAVFALVADPASMPRLALFAQGVDQYPDRSATVLLQVPSLESGPAVSLSGPGVNGREVIRAAGLPAWFWTDWRLNAAQFPLGVDIILTCGRRIVGLPRSVLAEG